MGGQVGMVFVQDLVEACTVRLPVSCFLRPGVLKGNKVISVLGRRGKGAQSTSKRLWVIGRQQMPRCKQKACDIVSVVEVEAPVEQRATPIAATCHKFGNLIPVEPGNLLCRCRRERTLHRSQ